MTHLHGNGEVWEAFEVYGTPSYVTITADGRVEQGVGTITPEVLSGAWIDT